MHAASAASLMYNDRTLSWNHQPPPLLLLFVGPFNCFCFVLFCFRSPHPPCKGKGAVTATVGCCGVGEQEAARAASSGPHCDSTTTHASDRSEQKQNSSNSGTRFHSLSSPCRISRALNRVFSSRPLHALEGGANSDSQLLAGVMRAREQNHEPKQ